LQFSVGRYATSSGTGWQGNVRRKMHISPLAGSLVRATLSPFSSVLLQLHHHLPPETSDTFCKHRYISISGILLSMMNSVRAIQYIYGIGSEQEKTHNLCSNPAPDVPWSLSLAGLEMQCWHLRACSLSGRFCRSLSRSTYSKCPTRKCPQQYPPSSFPGNGL
jgi:hypothetical protein